jgi:hypothetical protein
MVRLRRGTTLVGGRRVPLLKTFSRVCSAAVLCTCAALAGPPLTTIQDTLYKADGTRFNGIANIAWSGFEASDQSAIANQLITVKIVNGRLNVQLVPNTNSNPVAFYSVTYNSDGRVLFSETWAVPPSAAASAAGCARACPIRNRGRHRQRAGSGIGGHGTAGRLERAPYKGPGVRAGRRGHGEFTGND